MLTQIQPGMLAASSVRLENFSAVGTKDSRTLLSGGNSWIYQDSEYFDMGEIVPRATNMILLLLQATPIDFDQENLGYDAGSIV